MRSKSRKTQVAVGAVIFALLAILVMLSSVHRYFIEHWM
ncbi:hypothetical protein C7445_103195 [Alicyclobacillus sacchari]|uniref:Uncharacterized protein n=1 Tax=Alicyclobacillus sacchari TaxID=392010 RepID=A0A4R8LRE0_9BACL|nr:hypothetical protein URH17368_0646 [Alicyclobacillus hesperidum URH17-3-68]TDY50150.1 hypothetical protein C7445_103195 [Alicyclobacillus sacchari]